MVSRTISHHFCAYKLAIFLTGSWTNSRFCGDQNWYFKPNYDAFLNLTRAEHSILTKEESFD